MMNEFAMEIPGEVMSWKEEREQFQKRFDELSQENIQGLITDLNKAVGAFVSRAGLSENANSNPQWEEIQNGMNRVDEMKSRYVQLQDDIIAFLTKESKNADMGGILAQNGELQKDIQRLEKLQQDMKVDVESALARDELLRTRNTNVSRHQLFLLNRPVRRGMIPFLWILAVLFIGLGVILFKLSAPTITGSSVNVGSMLSELLSNQMILVSLLGSALLVILLLALKIAGVIG